MTLAETLGTVSAARTPTMATTTMTSIIEKARTPVFQRGAQDRSFVSI